MEILTNEDVLLRLAQPENSLVERKTKNDLNDCLKTVVAFANSTPIGFVAILFVGVRDGGEIEPDLNLDTLQLSFSNKVELAYPPIVWQSRIVEKDSRKCLAILIPGSENRPHFAGPSYVRLGSKTVEASDFEFQELISTRSSLPREILQWKNKVVTFIQPHRSWLHSTHVPANEWNVREMKVVDCNQFYLTLEPHDMMLNAKESIILRFVDLSFDHKKNRLEIREVPR